MSLSSPPWNVPPTDKDGRPNRLWVEWWMELVDLIPSGTLSDLDSVQTFENKTLLLPVIASFLNATHNHQAAAGGGQITVAAHSDLTATAAQINQLASGYSGTFQVISNMRDNVGVHEYKYRNVTFTNGVLTTLGAESAWTVLS